MKKINILVVDDEENIRLLFKEELEEENYQVEVASNGYDALEKLKKGAEPLPDQMAAFGISGKPSQHGLKLLFMSHPPLDDRIEALKKLTYR